MKYKNFFHWNKNFKKVVIQTEPTGIDPKEGHRLVEIAAIEFDEQGVQTGSIFHAYINPKREVPKEIVAVHGLDYDFLKDFPTFGAYKDNFLQFIKGKELIGQNIMFDLRFINYELGFELSNKITDTLELARKAFPGQRNNLSALCKRFNIEIKNPPYNGALLDALQMLEVYKKLKDTSK